ncbi:AsmA family protein [Skermanella mucosa]|uniref:AsmA family protein n=1 Tax=Skermanella mucosa TaxID=1789672 RepID=UPI00192B65C9|nr:AsmA family protein [Skermanella mucosa]UEM18598.1 AsmA family protein [Skermanella mucosa]
MARILGTITAVILGLAALCAGLVVMAGSAITLLEGERLGGVTGWAATKVAGRQVVVGGPVTIDWGTPTVVTAYGISVDNPDWASHPDLLDIATLRVGLDPASLLALDPAIPLLDVEQPKAFLERDASGRTTWQGLLGSGGKTSEPGLDLYGLEQVRVVDGSVTYRDAGSGTIPSGQLSELRIEAKDAASPISIQTTAEASDRSRPNAPPLQVSGSAMSLNDLRAEGAVGGDGAPVRFELAAAESKLTAEGQLVDPSGARRLDLRLTGSGPDAGIFLQYMNMRMAPRPGWRVEAEVSGSHPRWQVGKLTMDLGDTTIQGTADLDLSGQRPTVSADLRATPLALDQLREIASGFNTGNASGGQDSDGGSGLPLDMLTRFDGDIRLVADPIRPSELPVSSLTAEARVTDGTLTVDPLQISGAGGTVAGRLVVDAAAQPASHSAHADLDDLALDALLDLVGTPVSARGAVGGSLDLRASGSTTDDILSTLAVAADLSMDGRVRNVPLDIGVRIGEDGQPSGGTVPIRIQGTVAQTDLSVNGTATLDNPPASDLEVRAHGPSLAPILEIVGVQAGTPGLDHRLEANVHYEGSTAEIADLLVVIGASRTTGSGSLDLSGDRPMVRADLSVDRLALDELRGLAPSSPDGSGGESAGDGSGDGGIIPATSLPFDRLKQVDARISVQVAEFSGIDLPLSGLGAEATLDKGVLKVEPLAIDFAEGRTRTTATLDANARPPTLQGQVSVERISSDALLTSLGVTEQVQGLVSGSMKLASAGNTPDALAAGLDGQLRFYITDGRINTKLVNALALSFSQVLDLLFSSGDSTPVDCMIGSFDVTDGIVKPETLIFATPEVAIRGKGRIDLAEETLDLRFTPHPRERQLFSIAVPIELGGTLSDPTIDLGASLGAELARNRACRSALDRVSENRQTPSSQEDTAAGAP